jgi:hypothetical protein
VVTYMRKYQDHLLGLGFGLCEVPILEYRQYTRHDLDIVPPVGTEHEQYWDRMCQVGVDRVCMGFDGGRNEFIGIWEA